MQFILLCLDELIIEVNKAHLLCESQSIIKEFRSAKLGILTSFVTTLLVLVDQSCMTVVDKLNI